MLTKPCILHKCKIAFSFLQNSFAKICNSFREKEKHLAFAKCLLLVGMSGLAQRSDSEHRGEDTDPHLIFTRRRSLRVNGARFARQQGHPDAKFATLRVALQHKVGGGGIPTLYLA